MNKGWRWLALIVFTASAISVFLGNLVCLITFIHSDQFALKSPESPEILYLGPRAVSVMILGFLLAAGCLACGICCFRENGDR